jgi:hypothetical protein
MPGDSIDREGMANCIVSPMGSNVMRQGDVVDRYRCLCLVDNRVNREREGTNGL